MECESTHIRAVAGQRLHGASRRPEVARGRDIGLWSYHMTAVRNPKRAAWAPMVMLAMTLGAAGCDTDHATNVTDTSAQLT